MVYEAVSIDTAAGTEEIVVDTLANGDRIQVVRLDLGTDTTQTPVSGAVPVSAASLPLPSGAATSAAQTTGNASLATLAGTVAAGNVKVAIQSGATAGTEYTEGDVDATIVGQAMMWEDAGNVLRPVSAATPLPVTTGAAAISLSVLDDWDESDRGKVNVVVGQAGVQAGSGAVSANTQRVVLATDVALPAGANYMGRVRLTDGAVDNSLFDLANSNPLPVALVDTAGTQIAFSSPSSLAFAPTIGTGASAINDSLHTAVMTLANAAVIANGTGTVLGAGLVDTGNIGDDVRMWLFSRSVTGTTAQDALSISDADMAFCVGFIDFTEWANGGAGKFAMASRAKLPLPYKCSNSGTALYAILQLIDSTTPTYTSSGLSGFVNVLTD